MFDGLPRQGPGSTESTRRALKDIPHLTSTSRILDLGCGTGAQTLVLARFTPASIVAVDNHVPYVTLLNEKASESGIADRVTAYQGDMGALPFEKESFDLIWCEGAIYNIGVVPALDEWQRLLRSGGYIVFTEVCLNTSNPPDECRLFWAEEYPAIRQKDQLIDDIATCGYKVIDHFPLTKSDWWDEYYRPLQANVDSFRASHVGDIDVQELCEQCEREIDVWLKFSEYYDYEFFVLKEESDSVS